MSPRPLWVAAVCWRSREPPKEKTAEKADKKTESKSEKTESTSESKSNSGKKPKSTEAA